MQASPNLVEPSEQKIRLVSLQAKMFPMRAKTETMRAKMSSDEIFRCKLKTRSLWVVIRCELKNEIDQTNVPVPAKTVIELRTVPTRDINKIELKTVPRHELIAHKRVRIPIRTPRLHETAGTTTQQKDGERRKRDRGDRQGIGREKKRDRDSQQSRKDH